MNTTSRTDTTTSDTVSSRVPVGRPRRSTWARSGSYVLQRYSLVVLWALMVALFALLLPQGLDLGQAGRAVLGQQTPVVFLGLATVITLAVGEFDLSFVWIYGLAGTLFSSLVVLHGWPVLAAVLAALAAAVVVGLLNAVFVVLIGVNSIVVTLGTGSVAYGAALLVSNQANVSGLDPALSQISVAPILGLPAVFWYGVILVALTAYIMSATPLGRAMLFVGANRGVARLAGISVTRVRFGAYLVSALLCGLIGVILACGIGGFQVSTSQVQLLPVFAAVFLGTVAVVPGRFNPVGMIIAAYFLLTGVFGLQLFGATGWVTNIFYGCVLVAAVTISLVAQRRSRG
ncbi:MAG: ABC transporter permease [Candidatus Leucobacter sulfamidivorax]|nr:ABC transporter permease [Candidatus Leucobacter sulfamidivorax]